MLGPVVKIDPATLPRAAEHPLPRVRSPTTSCRTTSPAGTSRCCRLRATRRRGSSARRRHRSTWPPASPSSRRRFATSCDRTANRAWCASPTTCRRSCDACAAAMAEDAAQRMTRGRRVPAPDVVGSARGPASDALVNQALGARAVEQPLDVAQRRDHRQFALPSGEHPCSTIWSSAPDSPARRIAERLAAHVGQEGADLRQAAAHRRQRLRPLRRGRAFSSTSTGRTSSTPTRATSSSICRGSPSGGRTSIACSPASTASCCRFRSTSTPSTGCTAPSYTSFELEEFFKSVAEPRRAGAHVRRRHRQQGRPRAVREVLPQLHAQAVGTRSVRARRVRHRARAGPHQSRRSLLHRHLPGDAAARLHADVRADAVASEHQDPAERGLPRGRGRRSRTAR